MPHKKTIYLIEYCIVTGKKKQMKTRIIFGFILALTNLTNAITVYTLEPVDTTR